MARQEGFAPDIGLEVRADGYFTAKCENGKYRDQSIIAW